MSGLCANLHLAQTDNHASISPLRFLQAGCPSCRSTNSVKALKRNTWTGKVVGKTADVAYLVFLKKLLIGRNSEPRASEQTTEHKVKMN